MNETIFLVLSMYSDIKLNAGGIVGRFFIFFRPGHCSPAGVYNKQIRRWRYTHNDAIEREWEIERRYPLSGNFCDVIIFFRNLFQNAEIILLCIFFRKKLLKSQKMNDANQKYYTFSPFTQISGHAKKKCSYGILVRDQEDKDG